MLSLGRATASLTRGDAPSHLRFRDEARGIPSRFLIISASAAILGADGGFSAARREELAVSVKSSKSSAADGVRFAHASEAEFAKILDFYGIRWRYEPQSFPLAWDARGRVIESFNPDFYLPDHDLYIELTTLKQSLVTKKNRKIRRLRELYPHVHLKIFYNKDYRQLLLKYGLRSTAAAG